MKYIAIADTGFISHITAKNPDDALDQFDQFIIGEENWILLTENKAQKVAKNILANARLEQLRKEIRAERISYGEIEELKSLVKYIAPGDVELLEWAGVKEH